MAGQKLWEIDDGEKAWIMAPSRVEAVAQWRLEYGPEDEELTVRDVTDRAHTLAIRSDDDAGGPPRSARMWMDIEKRPVALIGASVW